MLRPLLIIFLFLSTQLPLTASGGVKARPQSGIGLLTIRADKVLAKGSLPRLLLYRAPKIGRLGERTATQLPGLAPAIMPVDGEWYAIVTERRPGWLRIIYDDTEREGWVEGVKSPGFQKWEQLLKGRQISLLPGLRKEYYSLRDEAALSSGSRKAVEKTELLAVEKVDGDWANVKTSSDFSGWLRWRDDNGRLMILLNPQLMPQKH